MARQMEYNSLQPASPLRELTCHMESHSVTCHPAEATFPPLPQSIKAGTRFSDPGGMQSWVDLVGLIKCLNTVARPSTNRAQRRVTSFLRRTSLPLRQTGQPNDLSGFLVSPRSLRWAMRVCHWQSGTRLTWKIPTWNYMMPRGTSRE